MKTVIIGQGAIGLLWYFKLSKCCDVSLKASSSFNNSLEYSFTNNLGASYSHQIKLATNEELFHAELLIICVKAYQAELALQELRDKVSPEVPIILCHNGMGSLSNKTLQSVGHPILAMLTTHASLKATSCHTLHTGIGRTDIGLIKGTLQFSVQQSITAQLNLALPQVHWQENIEEKQWQKLIVNAAINPLTAIYNVNNGQLVDNHYHVQVSAIISEACQVANGLGVAISKNKMQQLIDEVIKQTALNSSSMRQDILNNRQTEIDFITGFILHNAKKLHIATPVNEQLYHSVISCQKP